MKYISYSLLISCCFYLLLWQNLSFAANSSNKFYFEPFFKFDYQVWQNEQLETANDGNYTYKFRGLYYGPRLGGKFLGIYRNWLIYGIEGSYSYLFNTYSPDPGTDTAGQADDNFKTDSNASQIQFGLFTGVQYKRFGLKFQYIPMSSITNADKYSTFSSTETQNTYKGSGIGFGISYVYRPKVNIYIEYQQFTMDTFTIDDTEYSLPTRTGNMTFREFTTTKYSFGISIIF